MRMQAISRLRNHWHVLLILPLVIIVMTWPTVLRLFDADEFWVHNHNWDINHRLWDSWHLGQVLAGRAELWYSVDMYHPQGASLVFQHISFPHALFLLGLKPLLSADDANNLFFLLILIFNGFSAYVLVLHLNRDKWVALFGAVVVALGISFSGRSSVADLICIGTLPLTIYFIHRAIFECRPFFAALAGFCAGITAFIGMYTFAFILLSTAAYAAFLLPKRWRQVEFWRLLIVFAAVCAAISVVRIYPILADATIRQEGLTKYESLGWHSLDVLNYFVHTRNPFTGRLQHSLFNVPSGERFGTSYLGYINIAFLACALLRTERRNRLLPWLALLAFFAIMHLGDFLAINGVPYPDIVLPERVLPEMFPILFGQIGMARYYLYGLITPLAVLSCFGMAALIRERSQRTRALVALAAVLVVSFEFYAPLTGISLPMGSTAYVDWLKSQPDDPIKLINLPRKRPIPRYALYGQTLTGYPTAYGALWRNQKSTTAYTDRNWLLREWNRNRSGSCFGRAEAFDQALHELLVDGFSHIVVHRWGDVNEPTELSFARVPVAYEDGLVTIYRLRDMRLGCVDLPPELTAFDRLLNTSTGLWQPGSSLLSFHGSDRMDDDQLAYLDHVFAYTTNWDGLVHLYVDQDQPSLQAAPGGRLTVQGVTERSQVIFVFHASEDSDPAPLTNKPPLDQFQNCGRQTVDDVWLIERLLRRDFSCALFDPPAPISVSYDNGAVLATTLVTFDETHLEIQMRWDELPATRHAISLQLFEAAGSKALNQDFVVKDVALARHRLDISDLQPGKYLAQLILYDFNSEQSVSGSVGETSVRFERELEIATINRS